MYTTQANVEARLGTALTTSQASAFTTVVGPGVDAFINAQTGTSFGSGDSVSIYVETDDDVQDTLVIPTMHDITSVAKVNNDDTEEPLSVDDYFTWPRGKDDKFALKHRTGQWEYDATYKITGELGYKATPADITALATELAANALNTSAINNYKSEKVGDWAVTYGEQNTDISTESLETIKRYKRLSRSI